MVELTSPAALQLYSCHGTRYCAPCAEGSTGSFSPEVWSMLPAAQSPFATSSHQQKLATSKMVGCQRRHRPSKCLLCQATSVCLQESRLPAWIAAAATSDLAHVVQLQVSPGLQIRRSQYQSGFGAVMPCWGQTAACSGQPHTFDDQRHCQGCSGISSCSCQACRLPLASPDNKICACRPEHPFVALWGACVSEQEPWFLPTSP